jgi:hypothetical protein
MLQKMRVLLSVSAIAALAACGGGGDGDSSPPSFAGVYGVSMKIIGNPCNLSGLPTSLNTTQAVTQSDRNITLISGATVFSGTVDGDNGGFSTSNTQVSSGVQVVSNTNYRASSPAGTFGMQYSLVAGGCTVTYSGSAVRK